MTTTPGLNEDVVPSTVAPGDHPVLPPLEQRTFPIQVGRVLAAYPDRAAITDGDTTLSYAQVAEGIERLAGWLADRQIRPGDRVATILHNSIDSAVVWLALASYGAVGVPIDPGLPAGHVSDILAASAPAVVVTEAARLDLPLRESIARLPVTPLVVVRQPEVTSTGVATADAALADVLTGPSRLQVFGDTSQVRPWDLQAMMFTSGTTGRPKGTLVTQAQTITRAAVQPMFADRPVVSLVTLPLFHVVGQCRGLLGALLSGGTAVIAERFSVRRFWSDIDRFAVTHAALLGSMARFLMKADTPERRSGQAQVVMYMAPAIPEVAEFEERFGVIGVASYGSTEAGAICSGLARTLTCGTLHPEYEGRIVDDNDCPVMAEERGELVVRPRYPWVISTGYLDNPAASAELWRNGWFHTGDYFRVDDVGQLTFAGRKKQVIRRRGENINPELVEEALESHPDVVAALAVAVPSEHMEDDVKAIIMVRDGVAVEHSRLLEHARERLPAFAVPRYLDRQPSLPMTSNGKIDRLAAAALPPYDMWDADAGLLVSHRTEGAS